MKTRLPLSPEILREFPWLAPDPGTATADPPRPHPAARPRKPRRWLLRPNGRNHPSSQAG